MNRQHQRLNITRDKEMDLVDYLSSLGYQPAKIRSADYWYLSPLREERTPSFKVNRKLNCWYDHGLGKGGNLMDFGIPYHNCTVSELLQILDNGFSFHRPIDRRIESPQAEEKEHQTRVLDRDETGQNCSRNALVIRSKYKDESSPYQNHKDLNDWLMISGRSERKHFRQKLP
jgi:DNA primase